MADSDKKGISTGMAVGIGLVSLVLGALGAGAYYEMVVIPDHTAKVKADSSGKSASGPATTQGAK